MIIHACGIDDGFRDYHTDALLVFTDLAGDEISQRSERIALFCPREQSVSADKRLLDDDAIRDGLSCIIGKCRYRREGDIILRTDDSGHDYCSIRTDAERSDAAVWIAVLYESAESCQRDAGIARRSISAIHIIDRQLHQISADCLDSDRRSGAVWRVVQLRPGKIVRLHVQDDIWKRSYRSCYGRCIISG